jgi:signal transduction histidine kinase
MTDAPSIRRGLSRVVAQVSLAWSLAVFGVVWVAVHQKVDDVLDGALQESAEILYGLLHADARWVPDQHGGALPAPPHTEHLVWQLVSPDGHVRLRSHSAPAQALGPSTHDKWFDDGPEWHTYGMPFDSQGAMLFVAQPHDERSRARLEAAGLTAAGALLVGLICALWLSRRASRELEPLVEMSRQVANYHPLDEGVRAPTATREELLPLRDAIVHLGERLARNVASERAFSANAAHALRTPLAGLGTQLAVAQRECPPELQPRLQRAREAADRLGRVVTALLSLFRSGGEPLRVRLDLLDAIHNLPGIEGLSITAEGRAQADADPDLLAAALINLLDNSVRYGAHHARFALSVHQGLATITLVDDGHGVGEERRLALDGALARQHYEEGMGLGLMLADRVARVHGGRLRIDAVPQGFGVSLTLG